MSRIAAVAFAVLAACGREPDTPVAVTRLDDPRVVAGEPEGSVALNVPATLEESVRWNDMDAGVGISLLGATRLGPDVVKTYLMHRRAEAGRSALHRVAYAVDCRTHRMRVVGSAEHLDDAMRGTEAQPHSTDFPVAGVEREIFDKLCVNRMRCELSRKDNPCERELQASLERHRRPNAAP